MFEDNVLEPDGPSPQSIPASHEPGTAYEKPAVTARSPRESPAAKAPASLVQAEPEGPQATRKGERTGFLHRRHDDVGGQREV